VIKPLKQLAELRDRGIRTEEVIAAQKREASRVSRSGHLVRGASPGPSV
jgi:hypothetical protein